MEAVAGGSHECSSRILGYHLQSFSSSASDLEIHRLVYITIDVSFYSILRKC